MILADTSVWVDHLRAGDATLAALLVSGRVLTHPFVIGELALGYLRQRRQVLGHLSDLPQLAVAAETQVLSYIEEHALVGRGIGLVDAHLLAALDAWPDARLWTRDKRLRTVADALHLSATLPVLGS